MPTRRSSRRARRSWRPCCWRPAGCSLFADDPEDESPSRRRPRRASPSPTHHPTRSQGIQSALGRRADAVRRGDEQAFLAGLAKGDAGLARPAAHLLRQPPAAAAGRPSTTRVDPAGLVRDGEDYWVVVDLAMQLDGFDDEPVVTRDRFRFTPGDQPGRFRLASVSRPAVGGREPGPAAAVGRRRGRGRPGASACSAIFDAGSVRASDKLLALGASAASPTWPAWSPRRGRSRSSSTPSPTRRSWRRCPDLPGGDPTAVDGVAFPVLASPDGDGGAALVHPDRAAPADARRGRPGAGPAGPPRAHPRRDRRATTTGRRCG